MSKNNSYFRNVAEISGIILKNKAEQIILTHQNLLHLLTY